MENLYEKLVEDLFEEAISGYPDESTVKVRFERLRTVLPTVANIIVEGTSEEQKILL